MLEARGTGPALARHAGALVLDRAADEIAAQGGDDRSVRVAPSQAAYLLYTSGSTGTPKGVVASHGNLASFIGWAIDAFDPAAFRGHPRRDVDLLRSLRFRDLRHAGRGGAVVLAESAFALPSLARHDAVTMINTVPSVMSELIRLAPLPPSLRVVDRAGERLSLELARTLPALRPDVIIDNRYGPTEATVHATFARVDPADESSPPIGRAIAGGSAYVLDEARNPVPPGFTGERYLGGPGVTLGYWRRPELTERRFLADPSARRSSSRAVGRARIASSPIS